MTTDPLHADLCALAAIHLRNALAAAERGDSTEAGMELGDAACALADAGLPGSVGAVVFRYQVRTTPRAVVRSVTIRRQPAARSGRNPGEGLH